VPGFVVTGIDPQTMTARGLAPAQGKDGSIRCAQPSDCPPATPLPTICTALAWEEAISITAADRRVAWSPTNSGIALQHLRDHAAGALRKVARGTWSGLVRLGRDHANHPSNEKTLFEG